MSIIVKFFASFQDIVGTDQIEIQISETATIADVIAQLQGQYPQLVEKFQQTKLLAVNEQYAQPTQQLTANDTLAIFPLVSGG